MKPFLTAILFLLLFTTAIQDRSHAQSVELIGGNVLNGAITGSILGVATMGLNNTTDFTAFRIGLGSGILFGTGVAIYDVATVPRGQRFFISGLLNDGENSTIIILLDTVYGAAIGVALSSAIALIGNHSITDTLKYGAGSGAWLGFGFGMVDAFMLAERNRDFIGSEILDRDSLISIRSSDSSLKLIQPDIYMLRDFSAKSDFNGFKFAPALNLFSFNKQF